MDRAARIWYWGLTFALIAAIWAVDYVPTQDGPAHVYNSAHLREWLLDSHSPLREVYAYNSRLTTNLTAHLLLAPLTAFMSPASADKTIITLLLLVCAAGWTVCLRKSPFLLMLAAPLVVNGLLFLGFYSFLFGVGFMLLALGGVPWRWLWLALCWLSHPLCWAAAVAGVAAAEWPRWRRVALEAAPGAACFVLFTLHFRGGLKRPPLMDADWTGFLLGENPFVAIDPSFFWLSAGIVVIILALAITAIREGVREKVLAALAAAVWLAWPLAPRGTMTGAMLPRRVLLFALVFTLVWLGRQQLSSRRRWAVLAASGLLSTGLFAVTAWKMVAAQPLLAEYMTLSVQGRTLALRHLLKSSGDASIGGIDIFLHAGDWTMLRDGAIDVDNYEARAAHFPLRYRDTFSRGAVIGADKEPPCVRLAETSPPETVLLWDYPRLPQDACSKALLAQLESGYAITHLSTPSARGAVWSKNPTKVGSATVRRKPRTGD